MTSLLERARDVLLTADPRAKAAAARATAAAWRSGALEIGDAVAAPDAPARPETPPLVAPGKVPRRRLNGQAGRAALMHAIAHIEFNAIDLAFDLVVRFALDPQISDDERRSFIDDWIGVGDDEARHFVMVADRLEALDSHYGALPAHDGLWDAARATAGSLAARLAVAPLVLEARGLDVTPGMIRRLESAGDRESAAVLKVIYAEEVGHVAAGMRWFLSLCRQQDTPPPDYFQALVRQYFRGNLKPPFNIPARDAAEFPTRYYLPLV